MQVLQVYLETGGLSLYSTAMQNQSRWGLALVKTPNATILHWRYQHVGIQKVNAKLARPNAKLCRPNAKPGRPNASQWNIGCVGSPGIGARVAHVHFMLFVSISFVLGNYFR